ncbi:MAG: hypothetical protein ACRDZ3_09580, partial [Acidimicrobiia bacterium]
LRDREPAGVERERRRGRLFTTGLWYHRLCRALAAPRVVGQLSSALADAPPAVAAGALASVVELPDVVGLISLRELAWPMGQVLHRHRLNLITLEALCAARRVGATICLAEANDSPMLRAAARDLEVPVLALAA